MLTTILLLVVLFFLLYILYVDLARPKNYPPGPRGLPFVGNTPLIRKLAIKLQGQHKAFSSLAEEYKTPVLGLKLGNQLVVVALSPPLVREVLAKDEYIGRPDNFFLRLRCFGARRGITFADGDLWHEQRTFTLRTLRELGMGKPKMEALIQNQVQELIQQFKEGSGVHRPIEILSPCILRVLWEVVAGRRLDSKHPELLHLIHILNIRNKAFDIAGGLLSQVPWMRFIAPSWTGYNLIKDLNNQMKAFLMEAVNEHRMSYNENKTRDLIDAFLHEIKSSKKGETSFSDDQLLMVLVDLFLGGASSTTTTLDFAFLLMILYPDIQERVYKEILQVVGHDAYPTVADKVRLPYTEAVLLEIQRLSTVIPVTGPRRTLKETTLGGYFIPKNTTVLISQWSVHRDESVFPNASEFKPERFLDAGAKTEGVDNLIPFGLGKRRCIGESLAKPCLFLIFTGIIKSFRLETSCEEKPSLDPIPGIILTPKPYKIRFVPRC